LSNRITTNISVTRGDVKPKIRYVVGDNAAPIKGFVSIRLRDREGNILNSENHNQIVYIGRHHLARIVFNDNNVAPGTVYADTLKVAGGAVQGEDHFNPDPPDMTDEGLFETDPSKIKAFGFDDVSFSATSPTETPVVTLSKTLVSTDVKMLINELGVFFGSSGPMLAHYTCSTLDLREDAGTSLEVVWEFML